MEYEKIFQNIYRTMRLNYVLVDNPPPRSKTLSLKFSDTHLALMKIPLNTRGMAPAVISMDKIQIIYQNTPIAQ